MSSALSVHSTQDKIITNGKVINITEVTPHLRRFTFQSKHFINARSYQPCSHQKVMVPLAGQSKAILPELLAGGHPSI